MTTETASLIIKVDSRGAASASRDLDKLTGASGKAERATGALTGAWKVLTAVAASAALAKSVGAYIRLADESANLAAKLKLVTGSTEAATAAQRDLFKLSQATSSDLAATTELYVKLGQSSKELAGNHEVLLGITEKVSKALVISGADAASSAAVIRQFSQAMAAGSLRGDEFVSVMEGAPRLARALADGMGVAVGSLRALAADGKLTSEVIIKALENQGAVLDREFGEMPLTVGRATQQVRNALLSLVGDTEKTSGATNDLADAVAGLARALESEEVKSGFSQTINSVVQLASIVTTAAGAFTGLAGEIRASAREWEGFMRWASGTAGQNQGVFGIGDYLREKFPLLYQEFGTRSTAPDFSNVTGTKLPDFSNVTGTPPPPKADGSATSALNERVNAQRALNTEVERTLTMEEQWSALESEVYGPAAIEAHNRRVDAWAREGEVVEQVTDEMSEFAKQAARNMQDAFADFIFDPFEDGVSGMVRNFSEALRRMTAEVAASELLKAVGQWGNDNKGASGWMGALAGMASSMYGGQKAAGGPVMAGQGYLTGDGGEPEVFVPGQSGRVYPVGKSSGSAPPVVNVTINKGASEDRTEVTPNGNGGLDINVWLREAMRGQVASGALDGPMGARYGVKARGNSYG